MVGREEYHSIEEANRSKGALPLTESQKACLREIEKDFDSMRDDVTKQASTVQDFGELRLARYLG